MAGEEAPYLFRELEPARWREHLCAEPTTLLDALLAAEANGVVRLVNTNIKAPGTVAILERAPSDNALEHVEAVGKTMPGINDGLRPKIGQSAPSQLGSLRATVGQEDAAASATWATPLHPKCPNQPAVCRTVGLYCRRSQSQRIRQ